jgi:rubrerythrin
MECPHCNWKQIREARQTFISQEPTGNNVFAGDVTLPEMVDVYVCQNCGFSWRKQ